MMGAAGLTGYSGSPEEVSGMDWVEKGHGFMAPSAQGAPLVEMIPEGGAKLHSLTDPKIP